MERPLRVADARERRALPFGGTRLEGARDADRPRRESVVRRERSPRITVGERRTPFEIHRQQRRERIELRHSAAPRGDQRARLGGGAVLNARPRLVDENGGERLRVEAGRSVHLGSARERRIGGRKRDVGVAREERRLTQVDEQGGTLTRRHFGAMRVVERIEEVVPLVDAPDREEPGGAGALGAAGDAVVAYGLGALLRVFQRREPDAHVPFGEGEVPLVVRRRRAPLGVVVREPCEPRERRARFAERTELFDERVGARRLVVGGVRHLASGGVKIRRAGEEGDGSLGVAGRERATGADARHDRRDVTVVGPPVALPFIEELHRACRVAGSMLRADFTNPRRLGGDLVEAHRESRRLACDGRRDLEPSRALGHVEGDPRAEGSDGRRVERSRVAVRRDRDEGGIRRETDAQRSLRADATDGPDENVAAPCDRDPLEHGGLDGRRRGRRAPA